MTALTRHNFLLPEHQEAEDHVETLFKAECIPATTLFSDLKSKAEKLIPRRFDFIKSRSEVSSDTTELLDQLGVDFLVNVEGILFAIDVTGAKNSKALLNKRRKMSEIKPLLDTVGAVPCVLNLRRGVKPSKSAITTALLSQATTEEVVYARFLP